MNIPEGYKLYVRRNGNLLFRWEAELRPTDPVLAGLRTQTRWGLGFTRRLAIRSALNEHQVKMTPWQEVS